MAPHRGRRRKSGVGAARRASADWKTVSALGSTAKPLSLTPLGRLLPSVIAVMVMTPRPAGVGIPGGGHVNRQVAWIVIVHPARQAGAPSTRHATTQPRIMV